MVIGTDFYPTLLEMTGHHCFPISMWMGRVSCRPCSEAHDRGASSGTSLTTATTAIKARGAIRLGTTAPRIL